MLSTQDEAAFRQALDDAEADEVDRQNRVIDAAPPQLGWQGSPAPARRRGQVLIVAVLALIALIGIIALAFVALA